MTFTHGPSQHPFASAPYHRKARANDSGRKTNMDEETGLTGAARAAGSYLARNPFVQDVQELVKQPDIVDDIATLL